MFGRWGIAILGLVAAATVLYGLNRALLEGDSEEGLTEEEAVICSKEEIQALMASVEKNTNSTSPYSTSLPLLGAAYLNNKVKYDQWKKAFYAAFQLDPNDSNQKKMVSFSIYIGYIPYRLNLYAIATQADRPIVLYLFVLSSFHSNRIAI